MRHRLLHHASVVTTRALLPSCLLALVAASPPGAHAKPAPDERDYACASAECVLTVEVGGDGLNVLDWSPYVGEFERFGNDVHYTGGSAPPGFEDDASRLRAGGSVGYTDPVAGRCGGYYHVYAYSRGRKAFAVLSAEAPGCGPTDTTAPELVVSTPADDATFGSTVQVYGGSATDAGSGVEDVTLDIVGSGVAKTVTVWPDSSGEWSYADDLADGEYELSARATDRAGNTSATIVRRFGVAVPTDDATPPSVAIGVPAEDGQQFGASPTFGGTASDEEGGSGVQAVLVTITDDLDGTVVDGALATLSGENWSYEEPSSLVDGDYTLSVVARDAAGNDSAAATRTFGVMHVVDVGGDGYRDTALCGMRDEVIRTFTMTEMTEPTWGNEFDEAADIHDQLQRNWKSRYEWRQPSTDVITNNESQFYVDALGYDAGFRDKWTPFERVEQDGNGYLAIRAASSAVFGGEGPWIEGTLLKGQPYVSGLLSSFDDHPLSLPGPEGKITIEMKARMPRGQGVFPALWLYPVDYAYGPRGSTRNDEIDVIEYIGQSPCDFHEGTPDACDANEWATGYKRPDTTDCDLCFLYGRGNYDTFATQYHNYHTPAKGKLQSIGAQSSTGAIYTNKDGTTWWRGDTWKGCEIDFSEKTHVYTLEWSADAIVWYIDHIEVMRLDETTDDHTELAGIDFVPVVTQDMYLTINFALGSDDSYIGAPDAYTRASMASGELAYLIDYVRVWEMPAQ